MLKDKDPSWVTYLQLFLRMALFGSATPLSKLVANVFPVFIAGGFRVFLGFLVLSPFFKLSNLNNYKHCDGWLLLFISVFFWGGGIYGIHALQMKMVSGVTGSVVMSATPAITAFLSVIFFRDKIT